MADLNLQNFPFYRFSHATDISISHVGKWFPLVFVLLLFYFVQAIFFSLESLKSLRSRLF